jgi:hypothetical protein
MILVRELAAECGVSVSDVLTALTDINEFTLGADSSVRDIAADELRQRFRDHPRAGAPTAVQSASDEQLQLLRDRLAGVVGAPPHPLIDLTPPPPRGKAERRERSWRPDNPPLNKLVKALADQIVHYSYVDRRPPGVIFADEVTDAKARAAEWMKKRIEHGAFLSDDDIVSWIKAFPNEVLQPDEVFPLVLAGLTSEDARLRLWYGRINTGRLTLLQQIRRGDLSLEKAAADITEFKRKQSGA